MNKRTIITMMLALVAMTGQAQAQLESVKELTMKSEYFNHERQVITRAIERKEIQSETVVEQLSRL